MEYVFMYDCIFISRLYSLKRITRYPIYSNTIYTPHISAHIQMPSAAFALRESLRGTDAIPVPPTQDPQNPFLWVKEWTTHVLDNLSMIYH